MKLPRWMWSAELKQIVDDRYQKEAELLVRLCNLSSELNRIEEGMNRRMTAFMEKHSEAMVWASDRNTSLAGQLAQLRMDVIALKPPPKKHPTRRRTAHRIGK